MKEYIPMYVCQKANKIFFFFVFMRSCDPSFIFGEHDANEVKKLRQGDQIGRFFAFWLIVYFVCVVFSKITEVWLKSSMYICINFHKNGLGYILGNFSQPHLVTLMEVHPAVISLCRLKKCATYDRILRQDLTTGSGVSLLGVL
jgi:hypothetical protein